MQRKNLEEKSIFASILEIISTQLTKTVNVIESKNSKPEKKSEDNISRDGTNNHKLQHEWDKQFRRIVRNYNLLFHFIKY